MGKKTSFYDLHVQSNAKMVDFAGWDMPLHYGSQIQEHHQVRNNAGFFDVSHMGIVDLEGKEANAFLRRLLANDVDRLVEGKALYTCMLNEQGGVIDDLIVYKIKPNFFRLVINAGTREKDIAWMHAQIKGLNVVLNERSDLVMLAIQGPTIKSKLNQILSLEQVLTVKELKPFHFRVFDSLFIAATGYTGEEGYEFIFPDKEADYFWNKFIAADIKPCGLGARDTLRLEAGLNLYGSDMDESVTPLESNLAWTVRMEPKEREFIGREALEKQYQEGITRQLVGLVLEGPGIIRKSQRVIIEGDGEGQVTSGGYSPTLDKSIALARIPKDGTKNIYVEIRNKSIPAKIVSLPFINKREHKISC